MRQDMTVSYRGFRAGFSGRIRGTRAYMMMTTIAIIMTMQFENISLNNADKGAALI